MRNRDVVFSYDLDCNQLSATKLGCISQLRLEGAPTEGMLVFLHAISLLIDGAFYGT